MTVGDLRRAIQPLTDECPVRIGYSPGQKMEALGVSIEFRDGEGFLLIEVDDERITP
jgi:hypothetical protein